MPIVYISIGTNLGNRKKNIKKAISKLKTLGKILKVSSIYLTSPVENFNQPNFYNCVVKMNSKLTPKFLLENLKNIEYEMGRKHTKKRYQPRIIDLDILFYGREIIKSKILTIPHKKLHKRKFILWPLNEIEPKLVHPLLHKRISDLKKLLEDETQKIKIVNRILK